MTFKGIILSAWVRITMAAPLASLILSSAAAAEINVVPAVRDWAPQAGECKVASPQVTVAPADSPRFAATAELVRGELAAIAGKAEAPGTAILLTSDGSDAAKPEGYVLEIGDAVTIRAATATGAYYGTRTLLQMLRQSPVLPRAKVVDWPACKGRMVVLDVARKPFLVPVLKDYIRTMGWYKMNELHLHLSDESRGDRYSAFRIESKKFPKLTATDLFYTKQDLRDLQDFA